MCQLYRYSNQKTTNHLHDNGDTKALGAIKINDDFPLGQNFYQL